MSMNARVRAVSATLVHGIAPATILQKMQVVDEFMAWRDEATGSSWVAGSGVASKEEEEEEEEEKADTAAHVVELHVVHACTDTPFTLKKT
jgi:hypothetical protein